MEIKTRPGLEKDVVLEEERREKAGLPSVAGEVGMGGLMKSGGATEARQKGPRAGSSEAFNTARTRHSYSPCESLFCVVRRVSGAARRISL